MGPPKDLLSKILNRIKEERLLVIKRRIIFFSLGAVGSVFAFIPALSAARTEFDQSGIVQFFSLLFSNPSFISAFWEDFTLLILESLPVLSVAVILLTIFVFLGSLKFLVQDIMIVLAPSRPANNN